MMCKSKLVYVIFFLSFCFLTKAQKLKFDNYSSKDGLISDDVYKIFQDKNGYIWLFTDYGAMKYNGKTFEPVLKNLPFKESFIYSYYQNNKGQLWIANSNAKIYEVKHDSAFLVNGTEKVSENFKKNIAEIIQLYVDDSLNIYAVTKLFTSKFIKLKNYQGIDLSALLSSDSVAYTVLNLNNELLPVFSEFLARKAGGYFLTNKKIKVNIHYSKDKKIIFNLNSSVLTGPKIFKKYDENIYLCFYNKIVKIDADKKIEEIPLPSIITNFVKDKNGHLWVGCINNGLFEIDNRDSIINHYFVDKTVNEVLIDSQNGLWVSTSGFGLFHCKGFNTFFYDKTEDLGLPISLMKKIDNQLMVFNNQGDFFIVNDRTKVFKNKDISNGKRSQI